MVVDQTTVMEWALSGPACPLDGRRMQPWLSIPTDCTRKVSNSFSELYRCPCGYGKVWPSPSPDAVAKFYDLTDYYTHGGTSSQQEPTSFLDRLRTHLAWRADRSVDRERWARQAISGARTVCDLGCGGGRLLRTLKGFGYDVTGVEPDPAAVSRLSREKIEVLAGTAEELPSEIQGRQFDAVAMIHVLEHCIRPEIALRNVRRLLKDGGTFVCEVPNNEAIFARVSGPVWAMLDVPRHLHFFTGGTLAALCEKSGLKVQSVSYAQYAREFDNNWIRQERQLRLALGHGRWNSKDRAWLTLALTALAPAHLKYDSVRIVAKGASSRDH